MRSSLTVLAVVALASSALAQAPLNTFEVYSGRTSFTSRGFLSGAAGETLQGYPGTQFHGIGDESTTPKQCRVYAFGMLAQDQDRTTVEKYKVVFRRADATTTDPDGSAAGVIAMTGSINLPTATGTGPVAFSVTVNLGSAGVEIPCTHTFFAGVALSANAAWTMDGQSTHASAYTDPASTSGDPVRTGAINHAWQVDAKGVTRQTNPRSWRYNLQTKRGVFQVGCIQKGSTVGRYGFAGVYPDAKTQGLSFRLADRAFAGQTGAVFASTALIGGAPLPFDGMLWINPGTLLMVGSGKLSTTGVLELKPDDWAPGKLAPLVGFGDVAFQAVIEDIGSGRFNLRMMNAQATNL